MKFIKNIFIIISIFAIIQLIGMVFVSNKSYADDDDGFFDKVFSSGKDWKDMNDKSAEKNVVKQSMGGLDKTTNDVYSAVRYIGIGIILVEIVVIGVTLSMKGSISDMASAKITLGITFILALFFVFANEIFEGIKAFCEMIESML